MIESIADENFEELLGLIREYQQFYQIRQIDDEKNRQYFSQFILSDENGIIHVLRHEGDLIGFSTIYKSFSSSRAETVAVLNDLYLQPQCRKKGYGKMLISHAMDVAREKGYSRLQWLTTKDNLIAQKLYDGIDVSKSAWFFYAKDLK